MLFESFFNRVLRLFIWSVILAVVILLFRVGAFGASPQQFVDGIIERIYSTYLSNKDLVDFLAAVLGVVFAALSSSFAIYRTWYHAEQQLPGRLRDFVERNIHQHLEDRAVLVANINSPVTADGATRPIANVLTFFRNLRTYGVRRGLDNTKIFEEQANDLQHRIATMDQQKRDYHGRVVTAYLLKGLCLARDASRLQLLSPQRRNLDQLALDEFERALEFGGDDLDAIEFAAFQALVVEHDVRAKELLNDLVDKSSEDPVRRCRSRRHLAALEEKIGTETASNAARSLLDKGIRELKDANADIEEKRKELANSYLMHGIIQTKRERYFSAKNSLREALNLFSKCDAADRVDGLSATRRALTELKEARKDKGQPEDDD